MQKKRKRASFSLPEKPSKKEIKKEENEKGVSLVEVVVESDEKKDKTPVKTEVNIVVPPLTDDEEAPRGMVVEEVVESENSADKQESHHAQEDTDEPDFDDEEDDDEEELEVTKGEKVNVSHQGQEDDEEDEEEEEIDKEDEKREKKNQKEAVAELFGKGKDAGMPEITVHKQTGAKSIMLWAITMIAVAVGVGGGLILFTNKGGSQPRLLEVSPSESPTPTVLQETPTPTVKTISREDITVEVLNGSGKSGVASTVKSLLEEKGYTVSRTGNADSFSYETTEIVIKASLASSLEMIKQDLEEEYEIGETETTLPESSTVDVRVIVGKS